MHARQSGSGAKIRRMNERTYHRTRRTWSRKPRR